MRDAILPLPTPEPGCSLSDLAPAFRLPDALVPKSYKIDIWPDLEKKTFVGSVGISLDAIKSTNTIVLHALGLTVKDASFCLSTQSQSNPWMSLSLAGVKTDYDATNETVTFDLGSNLILAGTRVWVLLKYDAKMAAAGAMGGLSPCTFETLEGPKLGFETMFQPSMARAVFPCLDEPAFKATFKITMRDVDAGLTCLSNMELQHEQITTLGNDRPRRKTVSFKETPKMSTYLVVVVAGYYNCLESRDFHVPVRVWVPVDKDVDSGRPALELAVQSLRSHERNFGVAYPLPKLDNVAVPGHSGGMEHWGCVTYAPENLILSEKPSETDRLMLARIVAHELGHQWFGNIVTTKWWDSIWLNEAFADWSQLEALKLIDSKFDQWANWNTSDPAGTFIGGGGRQSALQLDANVGSHAIEDPSIPGNAAFDQIAYDKGCSVIRMMAEDMGVDLFFKGVSHYLEKHLYGNATTEDLWDALGEVSGRNIRDTMTVWTHTVGYPVLTVDENPSDDTLTITQTRLLQNGNRNDTSPIWPLSIHVKTQDGTFQYPMTTRTVTIPGPPGLNSYTINADQVGFYRVVYPSHRIADLWLQFKQPRTILTSEDKVGILSDLGAHVLTGAPDRRIRLQAFLGFLRCVGAPEAHELEDEQEGQKPDLFVWREILGQMERLRQALLFEHSAQVMLRDQRWSLLGRFVHGGQRCTLDPCATRHVEIVSEDSRETKLFKALVFSQMRDYPPIQEMAKKAFDKLIGGDRDALEPNLRRAILDTVVAMDKTEETYNHLLAIGLEKRYIRPTDPVLQDEALAALGSATQPALIARTLALLPSKAGATSPTQPSFSRNTGRRILARLTSHPAGAQAAWAWLCANWADGSGGQHSIASYGLEAQALAGLATREQLDEVRGFFAAREVSAEWALPLRQAEDVILARARFAEADWTSERPGRSSGRRLVDGATDRHPGSFCWDAFNWNGKAWGKTRAD